ncbi:MAG: hypothetical protein JKY61_05825 [Planctomycetes bacterium]|nr:hypothetical protein [Planctomycetota bacterium]
MAQASFQGEAIIPCIVASTFAYATITSIGGLLVGSQAIRIGGFIGSYNEAATPMSTIGIFDTNGRWTSFDNDGSFFKAQKRRPNENSPDPAKDLGCSRLFQ